MATAYASIIARHPSITIPCGMGANGIPFGLQIMGRRHGDLGVLAVAAQHKALIKGTDIAVPLPNFDSFRSAP